jgi:hypothetical protein
MRYRWTDEVSEMVVQLYRKGEAVRGIPRILYASFPCKGLVTVRVLKTHIESLQKSRVLKARKSPSLPRGLDTKSVSAGA